MKTIYKYHLKSTFIQTLEIHSGFKILSLQVQDNEAYFWAEVDTNAPLIEVDFRTIGTGHVQNLSADYNYIGTYQIQQGKEAPIFVAHVYMNKNNTKS